MELIFGTHNQNKVEEIKILLPVHYQLKSLTDLKFHTEIDETGSTLEENALIKARVIYNTFEKSCFADDSGLEVGVLGGKPGVYSARYSGNEKNAKDNMDKLLHELEGAVSRQAKFRTIIALIINGKEHLFEGMINGFISTTPKGQNGFGYDPIFIPENYEVSFAELTLNEKNEISHRSRAFQKLVEFLKS